MGPPSQMHHMLKSYSIGAPLRWETAGNYRSTEMNNWSKACSICARTQRPECSLLSSWQCTNPIQKVPEKDISQEKLAHFPQSWGRGHSKDCHKMQCGIWPASLQKTTFFKKKKRVAKGNKSVKKPQQKSTLEASLGHSIFLHLLPAQ